MSSDNENKLPSRFQLGDQVRIGKVTAPVTGICFREGKIHYEVGGVMYDSAFVLEPLRVAE